MIKNKSDLDYYLECDRLALGMERLKPRLFGDDIWKYEIVMRKLDYLTNADNVFFSRIRQLYFRWKYKKKSLMLGFTIPSSVIGPGLAIVHYGNIVISENCKIGKNCRIHTGVNIGANGGESEAAKIGDNVYIGPGAKIVGRVVIGDNVCIGANAVVVKDVPAGITIGGVPAIKISDSDSSKHLNNYLNPNKM